MAVEMVFDYENAKNLLTQSIENDARPIIILEAQASDRALLSCELFKRENVFNISYADFLAEYVYSIKKQNALLEFSYIVIDNVENLRGLSATLKILSTFVDNMVSHGIAVIFMGDNASFQMREVMHIIGSKIQYIMKIEPERI